jgi:hypothetical protein
MLTDMWWKIGFNRPLRSFKNVHRDEAMIVCGCGQSAAVFDRPVGVRTIGVNDFGRKFDPDYLLVIDAPDKFPPDRYRYIVNSGARYIFSDQSYRPQRSKLVRFQIRRSTEPNLDDPDALYYIDQPVTSPFMAVCLAAHMGASWIGMIGVDFSDHRFFDQSGPHILVQYLDGIDRRFQLLNDSLRRRGVALYNLSLESRLRSVPKLPLEEFLRISRVELAS